MNKSAPKNKISGIILAVLLGVSVSGLVGYFLPAGEFLSASSIFSSMLLAFIFGYSGLLSAVIMAATMLVSGYIAGDVILAGYLFIIGVLPGFVMIFGSIKGYKFFSQVRNALLAEMIAFVLVLFAVRAFTGQDFSSFFRTIWDDMISVLPQENKEAFAEILNELINQQSAGENVIATEDMLAFISEGMEQTLSLLMPFALVLYSVINGAVGVLWMNWLRVRHGEENAKYVPLSGWRLSKQITLGFIIIFIAVLIIASRAGEAGVSARMMVRAAISAAATIQACASFLSRFRMLGVSTGKRIAFLSLMILLSGPFFTLYGILSALFGVQGLFMPKRKFVHPGSAPSQNMNQNQNDQEDDDQNDKEDK